MKVVTLILIATTVGLTACRTGPQQATAVQPSPSDKKLDAVYKKLNTEPVPTPDVTPFDTDIRLRSWFRSGFMHGWFLATSGKILSPNQIIPPALPSREADCLPAWKAGAREGAKTGVARLLAQLDRQEKR